METKQATKVFRYLLELEIPGTERGHLADALEDEDFALREILGEDQLNRQIRDGVLSFDAEADEKQLWFREVIECLSVYLSTYVTGFEVRSEVGGIPERVLKYVGRRGEVLLVPLDIETVEHGVGRATEDVQYLKSHWDSFPRWAQDGYRLKFNELRVL